MFCSLSFSTFCLMFGCPLISLESGFSLGNLLKDYRYLMVKLSPSGLSKRLHVLVDS